MSEANKEIVRRFVDEVVNKRNEAAIDELIAENVVSYDPSDPASPFRGLDAYRTSVKSFRDAFGDVNVRVDDQIAEGDKVATRFTFTGRHEGDFFGVPATGKPVEVSGIYVDRIENGRIVEEWFNWDALGLMQQLGGISATVN